MKYDMSEYLVDAQRTKSGSKHPETLSALAFNVNQADMLHAAIGLSTESGEILDAFKKHIFYGKPLDVVNLKEEIGDILWYIAIFCEAAGTTFEALAETNIAKLKARYPEKFSQFHAENRNLFAEREILEKGA